MPLLEAWDIYNVKVQIRAELRSDGSEITDTATIAVLNVKDACAAIGIVTAISEWRSLEFGIPAFVKSMSIVSAVPSHKIERGELIIFPEVA